jgi:hypothetical protein
MPRILLFDFVKVVMKRLLLFFAFLAPLPATAQERAAVVLRLKGQAYHRLPGSGQNFTAIRPFELLYAGESLRLESGSELTLCLVKARQRCRLDQPGTVVLSASGVEGARPVAYQVSPRLPAQLPLGMIDFSKMAGASSRAGSLQWACRGPAVAFDLTKIFREISLDSPLELSYQAKNENWSYSPVSLHHYADGRTIASSEMQIKPGQFYQVRLGHQLGPVAPDFDLYRLNEHENAELATWEAHLNSPEAVPDDYLAYASSLMNLGMGEEARDWLRRGQRRFPDGCDWQNYLKNGLR